MVLPQCRRRVTVIWVMNAAAALSLGGLIGCSRHNSTSASPPTVGTGSDFGYGVGHDVGGPNSYAVRSPRDPAGAPTAGVPSGMGFYTGSAAEYGGMGTGLMGFHDVGAAGTSGAITDINGPQQAIAQQHGNFLPKSLID